MGDRRIEKEVLLEATPEQVWEAITTSQGLRNWFGPLDVEAGEGGLVSMTIGDFVHETAVVAVWDPPKRFSTTAEQHVFDYLISGREAGKTTLRLVHSGFFGEEGEPHFRMAGEGWDMYLHTLAQYLKYFPGRSAVYVTAEGPRSSVRDDAWAILRGGLGLKEDVAEGDSVRLVPTGLPPIDGILDYDRPGYFGFRTEDALFRFHDRSALGMQLGVGHHYFSAEIDRAETATAWQSWMHGIFAE